MQDLVLIVMSPLPSVVAQHQKGGKGGSSNKCAFISLLWGDLSNYLLSEPDIFNGTFFYQKEQIIL